MQTWDYEKTLPLSTYLYVIIAGPYCEIVCPEDKLHRGIKMSLFCRETLYNFALQQQHDIFEFTSDGIKRYEELFRYKYPFEKSDSVFCPEFTSLAMENPGAVTYNDCYIFKREPTSYEVSERASTILHEIAHMWFGDLVTMKWWDDLWLNESFADFVCYIILDDQYGNLSFPVEKSWELMIERKDFGYIADEMENTHPIAVQVVDTDSADSIFDGISYSKGASTMRQLYALIGRETFSKAMEKYFNKFAFKNATIEDFFDTFNSVINENNHGNTDQIEEHLDLKKFRKVWIEKAGLNTITCNWNTEEHLKNKSIDLLQGYVLPAHQTLRYHKIKVGLFNVEGEMVEQQELVLQNKEKTVMYYKTDCKIAGVVPNIDDLTFIKLELDNTTFEWIKDSISNLSDGLTRLLVWKCFFYMTRDANKQKSTEFIMLAFKHQPNERDAVVSKNVNYYLGQCFANMIPENEYDQLNEEGFNMTMKLIENEVNRDKPDEEILKQLKVDIVEYARTPSSIEIMKKWLEETSENILSKLTPSIEQKWNIFAAMVAKKIGSEENLSQLRQKLNEEDQTDAKKEFELQ